MNQLFHSCLLLLLSASTLFSQGVAFQKSTLSKAFKLAETTKKPLFIEVYLHGCPHCETLAPILKEKEVGVFFNKHLVSFQLEANAKESADFQKQFNITYPEFPLFLFFQDQKLIHIATPAEHTDKAAFIKEVLSHGQQALQPPQRAAQFKTRFDQGERDLMFLVQFAKAAKVQKDNDALRQINQAFAQTITSPQDRLSQAGFYILKRFVDDFQNPLAQFFFQHLPDFTKQYDIKEVREAGERIIFHTLYGSKGDSLTIAEITQMRDGMVGLGVEPREASTRTLLKELQTYLRTSNTIGAVNRFNQYRKGGQVDAPTYAYLLHFFNEKATDLSYLPETQQWATDGLQALKPTEKNTQMEADLYYEWAECLRRMNKKEIAKSLAQKSLNLAIASKIDLKKYKALLEKI